MILVWLQSVQFQYKKYPAFIVGLFIGSVGFSVLTCIRFVCLLLGFFVINSISFVQFHTAATTPKQDEYKNNNDEETHGKTVQ